MTERFDYITRIAELVTAELTGKLTEVGQKELEAWKNEAPENLRLYKQYQSEEFVASKFKFVRENDLYLAYREFVRKRDHFVRRKRRLVYYGSAVAITLLFILGGIFLTRENKALFPVQIMKIEPGKCRAVLTLVNGEKVNLSDTCYLSYAEKEYQVICNLKGKHSLSDSVFYHTITIPRGGEYALTLSDGSHIKMNSESEIRVPVHFEKNKREVYMSGEVFFDVARDSMAPFLVHTRQGNIQVLGTSFNVRDYSDENFLEATLISGYIAFHRDGLLANIKPGEQLRVNKVNGETVLEAVDVRLYCSWKDGRFVFEKQRLEEIMNTLSRWYNINVHYEDVSMKDILFTGNIKRYGDWDQVIEMLKLVNKIDIEIIGSDIFIKGNNKNR